MSVEKALPGRTMALRMHHIHPTLREQVTAPDELFEDVPLELIADAPADTPRVSASVTASYKVSGNVPYGPGTWDNVRYELFVSSRIDVIAPQTAAGIQTGHALAEHLAHETALRSLVKRTPEFERNIMALYPELFPDREV